MHQRSDRSGANESSWCCQSKRQLTHQGTFLRKWIDAKLMTKQVCYVNSAFRWKKEKLLCFSFYLNNISQIWPNSGLFKGISLIKNETRDRLIFHHIFNWTNLSALRSTESSKCRQQQQVAAALCQAKQEKRIDLLRVGNGFSHACSPRNRHHSEYRRCFDFIGKRQMNSDPNVRAPRIWRSSDGAVLSNM